MICAGTQICPSHVYLDTPYLPNFTYVYVAANPVVRAKVKSEKEVVESVMKWQRHFEKQKRSIAFAWLLSTLPFLGIVLFLIISYAFLSWIVHIFKHYKRIEKAKHVKIIEDLIILMTESKDEISHNDHREILNEALKPPKLNDPREKIRSNLRKVLSVFKCERKSQTDMSTDILSYHKFDKKLNVSNLGLNKSDESVGNKTSETYLTEKKEQVLQIDGKLVSHFVTSEKCLAKDETQVNGWDKISRCKTRSTF